MKIKRNDVFEALAGFILGYAGIMIVVWYYDLKRWWRRKTQKYIPSIMLSKFERGLLKGRMKNYVGPNNGWIIINVDIFRGKERICWDCGNIRLIDIIFDLKGGFIKFGEGCAKI